MRKEYSHLLFFSGIIFLLIILNVFKIVPVLEFFEKNITRPVQVMFYNLTNRSGALDNDLTEKNQELETRVNELILENAQLKLQEKENEILRKELNFLKQTNYDFVIANVVGKMREIPGATQLIIIDRGKKDGIDIGYPVVISTNSSDQETQGFLIGKVVKANQSSAQVLLITDQQSSVAAAVISQDSEFNGLVSGKHGLSMEIDLIPVDKQISNGDLVVTSGLENYIPRGLVIGEIENVETKPSDLFQKATIKSLISFDNFRVLIVIRSAIINE